MNIIGKSIILRGIEKNDNDMLLNLINDPETEAQIGGISFPVSSTQQENWFSGLEFQNNVLRCIVAEKNNIVNGLGTVILSDIDYRNGTAEIHIKMDKEKGRCKGYGTDAINTLVKYGFRELRLQCIYAEILASNDISKKLFDKCGFEYEGTLRNRVFKNGIHQDIEMYSIINYGWK